MHRTVFALVVAVALMAPAVPVAAARPGRVLQQTNSLTWTSPNGTYLIMDGQTVSMFTRAKLLLSMRCPDHVQALAQGPALAAGSPHPGN